MRGEMTTYSLILIHLDESLQFGEDNTVLTSSTITCVMMSRVYWTCYKASDASVSGPLPACFWQFPDYQHPVYIPHARNDTQILNAKLGSLIGLYWSL